MLGHSGCGAVTAAVDVFLNPADYLALASEHTIRMLVDRLQVVVHSSAARMDHQYGAAIRQHPRFRQALIEVSVLINAALAARTLQKSIDLIAGSGIRTAYGVYVMSDRSVWAPRAGSDKVRGVAVPPSDAQGFIDLGNATLVSRRMTEMLSS